VWPTRNKVNITAFIPVTLKPSRVFASYSPAYLSNIRTGIGFTAPPRDAGIRNPTDEFAERQPLGMHRLIDKPVEQAPVSRVARPSRSGLEFVREVETYLDHGLVEGNPHLKRQERIEVATFLGSLRGGRDLA
jgi:hypothetical protein